MLLVLAQIGQTEHSPEVDGGDDLPAQIDQPPDDPIRLRNRCPFLGQNDFLHPFDPNSEELAIHIKGGQVKVVLAAPIGDGVASVLAASPPVSWSSGAVRETTTFLPLSPYLMAFSMRF